MTVTTDLTTEMMTPQNILKYRFLSDLAGSRAEGQKPGVCPAKTGKWTAYLLEIFFRQNRSTKSLK